MAVTMAGFAGSLVLAGCGPQPVAPAAEPNVTARTTADRTANQTVPPASTAAPSAVAPAAPVTSGVPSQVPTLPAKHGSFALRTFTFPDGHISFAYPETWSVRTVLPPDSLPGIEAVVADGAGNDLLLLSNGVTAGCTGGPVTRHVFDQVPVPGMTSPERREPSFGFAVETYGEGNAYVMGLTDPRSLTQGDGVTSWCSLVSTANGGLFTRVLFEEPGFPNRGAAQAWMATDEYAQLKALLVSLTYA